MKRFGITVLKVMQTAGITLALLFVVLNGAQTAHAYGPLVAAPDVSFIDRIFEQMHGVAAFTAQAIQAVLAFDAKDISKSTPEEASSSLSVTSNDGSRLPLGSGASAPLSFFDDSARSIIINVPLIATDQFSVQGVSDLSTTTVHHAFVSTGNTEVNSLVVLGTAELKRLSVSGSASLGELQVSGTADLHALNVAGSALVSGNLTAQGGITTNGADINAGTGNVYAANLINKIIAGSNISIGGSPSEPIISAKQAHFHTPNLEAVRAVGGCQECITNFDVQPDLTIFGGLINNTPIGLTTAASAAFADVRIGTSSATTTLTVHGDIKVTDGCVEVNGICLGGGVSALNDLSDVTVPSPILGNVLLYSGTSWINVATSSLGLSSSLLSTLGDVSLSSTTAGQLLFYDGTNWTNISTSTLGLGDGSFLGLSDTPSAYVAGALSYVNATGSALTQSGALVFDGSRLGIGTSTPIDALSVAGNIGVLGRQTMRFYDALNTHYAGLRASSTLSSNTVWSLPASDGMADEIMVTDGLGNLRFASVGSVGGGSATYLGLSDTPSSFISNAVPYTNASGTALTHSANFTFDGSRLGIGTNAPTSTLTVQGSVQFRSATSTAGLTYNSLSNRIGIGTADPSSLLGIEGGSITQRGAASGGFYRPAQLGSIDMPDNATDVAVAGSYAYVTTAGAGDDFHIIDISDPNAPAQIGSLSLSDGANAVYVSGKYAYVATNLIGNDFHIIDISDPANPVEISGVALSTTASDVIVQGYYAYVTTTGTGNDVHVINISDRSNPVEVGSLNLSGGATGVAVNDGYLYVTTNDIANALYVIDVHAPSVPSVKSSIALPAAANDIALQGRYAYIVSDATGNSFSVVNISNPSALSVAGSTDVITSANAVSITGSYAYVVTAGTGDDFHVIDIGSPSSPVEVGSEDLASGAGLGVAVSGNHAYAVTSSVGNDFHVMDITGIDVQSGYVDSLKAGSLATLGDVQVAGALSISKGLRVGIEGLQTDGALYVQSTSSTSFIQNKLGIGTSTPMHALSVAGGMQITGAFYDSTNNAGSNGFILQSTAIGQRWVATSTLGISADTWSTSGLNAYYSTGNVGIGTTSPDTLLTVNGSIRMNVGSNGIGLLAKDLSNTNVFSLTRQSNDLGLTAFGGIGFAAGQTGGPSTAYNMYIANTGNIGIGTSTPSLFKLQIAGSVGPDSTNSYNLGSSGSNWGCLYYNSGTLGTCASDQRLKTGITDLSFDTAKASALDQLSHLRLRSFAYRTATSSRYDGLIAQEVQQFSPELVVQDPATAMLAVKYGDVQWLTVEAVQQLNLNLKELLTNGTTSASSSLASLFAANSDTVWSRLSKLAHGFADGVLTVIGIHAEEVSTDTLCVGATCMNEEELKTILHNSGTESVPSGGTHATDITTATTTDTNGDDTQVQDTATSTSPVSTSTAPLSEDPITATSTVIDAEPPVLLEQDASTTTNADPAPVPDAPERQTIGQ